MSEAVSVVFKRQPDVCQATGFKPTALQDRVEEGLLTPPVKIGPRAIAWPQHEIDAINAARLAGWTDAEIRALVTKLVAARSAALRQAA